MTRFGRRAVGAAAALGLSISALGVGLLGASQSASTPDSAAVRQASAQLAEGVAAVEAGNFQAAVITLSGALRGLAQDPAQQADLVRAYLHLGVAFAGLGQESPARSQFTQALLRRPDATLDVKNAPENARRLFKEAQGEAAPVIAAAEEGKKKGSRKPALLAGLAVVGAGVGVATVAGNKESDVPPTTLGPINPGPLFQFTSLSGNPYLAFGGGNPPSGTTIQVGATPPRFVYRAQYSSFAAPAGPHPRLQATVDLVSLDRGPCWHAESPVFSLASGEVVEVVIDAFPATPGCVAPFTTLRVEARLFDREVGRQVSATIYAGGYRVVP